MDEPNTLYLGLAFFNFGFCMIEVDGMEKILVVALVKKL
jgi:hypothetical protein